MGHEREAVLRRNRDQSVGCGLLRPTETVSGRPTQVSRELCRVMLKMNLTGVADICSLQTM